MQKIDIYLSRISQLVQIGLFAVTLFTLYYTVIPLYKNAQLEESLARKEMEYESLRKRSENTLSKVNKWEYRQFVMSSAECSGLPKVLLINDAKPDMADYLPVDVVVCLRKTLSEYEFTDLSAVGRSKVENRISDMSSEIEDIYKDHQERYDGYPEVLDKQLAEGNVPKSAIDEVDKALNELGYKISEAQKRESYISGERYKIQLDYFSAVQGSIIKSLGDRKSLDTEIP
ncbi:hypothetical protein QVM62_14285 [Pseudomonas putida]|uniref:hypothetical protein n=1 Tax=Pseudomonas putida TaxID=303 RepID=UPI0035239652